MKRYAMSPRGKRYELTDAMIDLRNRLAVGLGYVLRPCSMGPNPKTGEHRDCWERPPLDHNHRGQMISSFHSRPQSRPDPDGGVWWHWPEQAETAAHAIDRGKPLPDDPDQLKKGGAKTKEMFPV